MRLEVLAFLLWWHVAEAVWGVAYSFSSGDLVRIHKDLHQIQTALFASVRTNQVVVNTFDGPRNVLALAAAHNLSVTLSLPIQKQTLYNASIEEAIRGAKAYPGTLRALYLGQHPGLIQTPWRALFADARRRLDAAGLASVPVGVLMSDTALLANATDVANVDVLGAVLQPFLHDACVDAKAGAAAFRKRSNALRAAFGAKVDMVVTGWPASTPALADVCTAFSVASAAAYYRSIQAWHRSGSSETSVYYEAFTDASSFDFGLTTSSGHWKFDVGPLPRETPSLTAALSSSSDDSGISTSPVWIVCIGLVLVLVVYAVLVFLAGRRKGQRHLFDTSAGIAIASLR
ncbi:hypothetical protein SPRG_07612 [Saprolegnia parasitica CBS 223.65]|uniref:glucan endo-1,3-beta-D-glucosidase n=1 Tax=Saprolegnia parasitica (strain CBS 223.65) TaxID=695850 RepID=A0A067CK27_SAPPC|nr:hypothetical protein SPRG_07612 [Saprolegnia parasitica CBS 223.65]KDO26896.1 hypothetical protein SPRG_07612 [Saprolegnia parasitica CBS 223.65]|eukprot:XP_012202283.1 hypothetical protein SPRG_07612 [Saprolegnia parasitica CBS 223.65]